MLINDCMCCDNNYAFSCFHGSHNMVILLMVLLFSGFSGFSCSSVLLFSGFSCSSHSPVLMVLLFSRFSEIPCSNGSLVIPFSCMLSVRVLLGFPVLRDPLFSRFSCSHGSLLLRVLLLSGFSCFHSSLVLMVILFSPFSCSNGCLVTDWNYALVGFLVSTLLVFPPANPSNFIANVLVVSSYTKNKVWISDSIRK